MSNYIRKTVAAAVAVVALTGATVATTLPADAARANGVSHSAANGV